MHIYIQYGGLRLGGDGERERDKEKEGGGREKEQRETKRENMMVCMCYTQVCVPKHRLPPAAPCTLHPAAIDGRRRRQTQTQQP